MRMNYAKLARNPYNAWRSINDKNGKPGAIYTKMFVMI